MKSTSMLSSSKSASAARDHGQEVEAGRKGF